MLHQPAPFEPISPHQAINLFFALMPEAAAANNAHRIAKRHSADRRMRGRPLAVDRLHITLLSAGGFRGKVPGDFMRVTKAVGDAVRLPPFEVTLDSAVSFARASGKRPYVLLGGDGVAGIMPLHQSLVGGMWRAGLDIGMRPIFNPHMTLAYDAAHHTELPVEPVTWVAREFALIESLVGLTRHIVRGRWPLR